MKTIFKNLFCKNKKEKPEGHWSDNHKDFKYRIIKHSNDNGMVYYIVEMSTPESNWEWEHIGNSTSINTEKEARQIIEDKKRFYQKAWNIHYTHKREIIEVE